jgi:N-acetylmuramoyl-L-alanine amidase
MPAAVVKLGYLSNADELSKLTSDAYQVTAAGALARGVCDFLAAR